MNINEIKAKSIVTKSNLPASDYVINPYIGCSHSCIYCYARFMKRFTGHLNENWGDFVDVKINAQKIIPENVNKLKNKSITIGSVTDPYQTIEKKYQITRQILQKLVNFNSKIDIITKSNLIKRDIDLLKKIKNLNVAFSISRADDNLTKLLEPRAPVIKDRINALKKLHQNNIQTTVFISPIFPTITNWQAIIKKTKKYTNEYWFENLNIYPSVKNKIYFFLKKNFPQLTDQYNNICSNPKEYWHKVEKDIIEFCKKEKVKYKIYFHHRDIKKKL